MIKTYEPLYSRDSLNRIRVWQMEQNGSQYRTVAGLQDGEKVTSDWTVAEPKNTDKKNATSGSEQSTKEIEAKYKKQKKTGYFEDIKDDLFLKHDLNLSPHLQCLLNIVLKLKGRIY